jgi:hypothetical protein
LRADVLRRLEPTCLTISPIPPRDIAPHRYSVWALGRRDPSSCGERRKAHRDSAEPWAVGQEYFILLDESVFGLGFGIPVAGGRPWDRSWDTLPRIGTLPNSF